LPSPEFADIVRLVSEQLKGKGRVEMKLVNLLELEIIVTENGRSKRATHQIGHPSRRERNDHRNRPNGIGLGREGLTRRRADGSKTRHHQDCPKNPF
jgi:hypothetical protein